MKGSIPAAVRAQLPKARLIDFRWTGSDWSPLFIKTRGANFAAVWFGPLQIVWRMPWLPDSARALHPHLFRGEA